MLAGECHQHTNTVVQCAAQIIRQYRQYCSSLALIVNPSEIHTLAVYIRNSVAQYIITYITDKMVSKMQNVV